MDYGFWVAIVAGSCAIPFFIWDTLRRVKNFDESQGE